ncbi:hypothetical protein BGZ83_001338 [Gryganskiella cystojenkinii]|nr:hypothetical protein BGZ83_001338 [Gryganskiella cystojenkinii]
MTKLSTKRDKSRGWTASTFLPDNSPGLNSMEISSNLDVISEDSMDEDSPVDNNITTTITPAGVVIVHQNGGNSKHNFNGSTSRSSSGQGESDDDDDNDHDFDSDEEKHGDEDEEEDEDGHSSSSQERGTSDSEQSEEDSSSATENDGVDMDNNNRSESSKRSHTGNRVKKSNGSNGASALSTSPSSSSKVVSATPTRKITKKSKKSVKAKGSKGALSSAAARQATEQAKFEAAKPVVSRFLDAENTKLNDKLLQVFMTPGILANVIEYITRLDPDVAKELSNNADIDEDVNQETLFMTRVQHCSRKRDFSDLNLMKKSYTAMNFIVRTDVYNEFILSSGHQTIVKELFKIFRPESNGNFYHFQKVFETVLKKFRSHTMATLFEDTDPDTGLAKTPLIFEMLPFLDQSPVALSFIKVLFPTYTYGFGDKMPDYYRTLQRGHFMEMLLAMVTLKNGESCSSMGDFVVLLLDEATRAKEAKIFFSCFADDPIWAERLVQGVQSAEPSKRHSSRLWLLDSIYHCLNDADENAAVLQSMSERFWAALVNSFIQFPFNNAYHVQFYKMFRVALYSQQADVYNRFFVETHMINRFIDHFKAAGQTTGSRGYIILILNCIRLSADLEYQRTKGGSDRSPRVDGNGSRITPTYWTDYLRENEDWNDFKATLREVTLEQTRDTLCDMDPNLRFQFAPLQSRQPSEAPLTKRHFGIPGVSVKGNNGIDLGSQYGNSLGFGVPMDYDPAQEERIKAEAERKQELEVEKALANMMPTMDWKLIPPQRVLDAMREMNQASASTSDAAETESSDDGSTDSSESRSSSATPGVTQKSF